MRLNKEMQSVSKLSIYPGIGPIVIYSRIRTRIKRIKKIDDDFEFDVLVQVDL